MFQNIGSKGNESIFAELSSIKNIFSSSFHVKIYESEFLQCL